MSDTQLRIAHTCDSIKDLLLDKNAKYGDSALNPTRVFSKLGPVEQLYVRIDDKLSRISKGAGLLATDEDVINDLIGYLVLLKIALQDDAFARVKGEPWDIEDEQWDGTDVEPISFGKTPIASHVNDSPRLNDTDWFDMYAAGDKFA
jgi:hypothetical protein